MSLPNILNGNSWKGLFECLSDSSTLSSSLLIEESDLLLECKVCRQLFRSVPLILSHKRFTCKMRFVEQASDLCLSLCASPQRSRANDSLMHLLPNDPISSASESVHVSSVPRSLFNHLPATNQKIESSEAGSSLNWIEAVAECKEREERKAALDDMIPDTPQLTLAPIHIGSDDCSMIASCAHAAPSSSALETSSSCAAPSLTAAEAVARSLGAAVDVDVAVFSPLTDTALAASAQSQLAQCQRDAAESAAARSLQHWGCATAAQLHFTSVQPAHALAAEMRTPHRASTHGASLQRALQLLRHNQERRELDTLWQLASMAAASILRPALMQKASSDETASSCSSMSNEGNASGGRRKRTREEVASRPSKPEWLDLFDRSAGAASAEPLELEAQDAPVGTFGAVVGGRVVRSEQRARASKFERASKVGGDFQGADDRPSEVSVPENATPVEEDDKQRAELIQKLSKRSDCDAHRLLCCLCNEQQATLEALDAHMAKHETGRRYKFFQCTLCPLYFPRLQRVLRHLVNAHALSQRAAQTLSQQIRTDARYLTHSPARNKVARVSSPPRNAGPSAATSSLEPSSRMLSALGDASSAHCVTPATANHTGHTGPPSGALLKLRTASHNSQSTSFADRSDADADPELPTVQKFVSPSNSVIMPLDTATRSNCFRTGQTQRSNGSGTCAVSGDSNSGGYVCTCCGQSFARLSALKNHRKLSHPLAGSPEVKVIAPSSEKLCMAPVSSRTSPVNRRHSSDETAASALPSSNNNAAANKSGGEQSEQRAKRARGSSAADSPPGSNPVVIRFDSPTRVSSSPPATADAHAHHSNAHSGGALRATCPTEENEAIFNQIGSLCDARNLRCRQCGSRSSSIQTLRRHAATHLGIKRFRCPKCSFAAFYAAEVRHHCKLKHHSDQQPIPIALRNSSASALPAAPSSALLASPVEPLAAASSSPSTTSTSTVASSPPVTPVPANPNEPSVSPRLTDASGRIRRFARITAVE